MVIPEILVSWLTAGHSLFVGTRDVDAKPDAVRAVGLHVAPSRDRFTVYLSEATSGRAIANLGACRTLALCVSEPPTHRTVQLKGAVRTIRAADDDERALLEDYRERWGGSLAYLGMPRAILRRVANWPARAVEVDVEAIFEQTPGPGAGAPLRGDA